MMGMEEWLGGERREVRSLLMKIGATASLSLAGYLFYRHEQASREGAGARESRGNPKERVILEELQNRLKMSAMEAELLSVRIDLLQAEKKNLEEQLIDYSATKAELEIAKGKLSNLKRKVEIDSAATKEIIAALREKVSALREHESRLGRLSDLELEVAELREMNSKLANPHEESEETRRLKQRNDELAEEIDQMQSDRCADAEELVYLKWVNACLRHKLRNHHSPSGRTTARDLSKSLSPKSEQKVKQLIKEYANPGAQDRSQKNPVDFECDSCSSSQMENSEKGDLSADATSATKSKKKGKTKFLAKLKNLVLRKDNCGSPKSFPDSARRSTVAKSWLAEDSVASSTSCDNDDHQQEIDQSWTRNLCRISQDFWRLKNRDHLVESPASARHCRSDLRETWRMRSGMSEEDTFDVVEKISERSDAAPETSSSKKSKGRLRSLSFSSGGKSFLRVN